MTPGGSSVHRKRAATQVAEDRGMKLRRCLIGVVHCFLNVQTGIRRVKQTAESHLIDVRIVILLASLCFQSLRLITKCLHLPTQWANAHRPRPGLRCAVELAGPSTKGLSYQGRKIGQRDSCIHPQMHSSGCSVHLRPVPLLTAQYQQL